MMARHVGHKLATLHGYDNTCAGFWHLSQLHGINFHDSEKSRQGEKQQAVNNYANQSGQNGPPN